MTISNKQTAVPIPIQSMEQVKSHLHDAFGGTEDLALVTVLIGAEEGLLCYLKTMTSVTFMMENVIKPLSLLRQGEGEQDGVNRLQYLKEKCYGGLSGEFLSDIQALPKHLTAGKAGLWIHGVTSMLILDVMELISRSVDEPTTQTVVRGPKEGFTESAQTNMSLIRRRLANEHLRFDKYTLGAQSGTDVYAAYIEGQVDDKVLRKVKRCLSSNKVKSLFDSGSLEEMISSSPFSLFPLSYNSERPDAICALLLERRIAVIVNGSPFVLAVPAVMNDFFKSPEDYYQWFAFGTFTRMLRYLAFLFSLYIPSLYVAVTSYQQELIPTALLTSIAAQREGVPFPAVIEILAMEITFDILREAGTRMPRVVGQAISIVGALVLGEAAVQAGIISNINVIVVSLTAISGFVAPVYTFGANVRLMRFGFIILASILGLFGVIIGTVFLLIHLARLESFGVPYLSPFSPFRKAGQKDALLRFPILASSADSSSPVKEEERHE
ncbi:spore germination protein [Paenibacillus solisilvae]|uniref:Spore germination protein n=1 Tax=Paenibacillus solisilvae TaxID=2486751 RepID=A0ABW0W7J7_9BACL